MPFAARAQGRCGCEGTTVRDRQVRGSFYAGAVSKLQQPFDSLSFSWHYACTIVRTAAGEGRSFASRWQIAHHLQSEAVPLWLASSRRRPLEDAKKTPQGTKWNHSAPVRPLSLSADSY